MNRQPFGRLASACSDPASLVELEAREGKAESFNDLDLLLASVTSPALKGEAMVKVDRGHRSDAISIPGIDDHLQAVLVDRFSVANQHARGAWLLPETVNLKVGWINLPSIFAKHSRFATGLALEDRARALLADSPAAVFLWSVLEPFSEQLFIPFELRGHLAGAKSRGEQLAAWVGFNETLSSCGFDLRNELTVMQYGGGWGRLGAAEQLTAKQHLLAGLAGQACDRLGAGYRAYRLLPVIARYYAKAKNGQARRKQVLTRSLEKTLTGFFGGDWLRLLTYLGEEPHPDEEIVAAIPQTKLFLGGTKSSQTVAAEVGVPAEEVERALSSYWDSTGVHATGSASPVDERVGVLKTFWATFDEIHGRQAPGMESLWGLVEDSRAVRMEGNEPEGYSARLYSRLLPNELLAATERLWGSIMLPRWPDRIVSEISPQGLMAEAFGSCLEFWHGCSLTAWFVCEGPTSRTDVAGLATYYQSMLESLEELGCPVDPVLFAELREAESHLGPQEPIVTETSSVEVIEGMSIRMSTSTGCRRSGFEFLRDIIARHRRVWARRFLDSYLRARWETEVREAARFHAQAIAAKGKQPTPKQFAKHAERATNHWFGGDLSAFYRAIGEKSAVHPVRSSLMPADRLGFITRVFDGLGGTPFERKVLVSSREEHRAQAEEQGRHWKLRRLAEQSLRFIQLQEALGRAPELREFGTATFQDQSVALSPDSTQAWDKYEKLVLAASANCRRAPEAILPGGLVPASDPPPQAQTVAADSTPTPPTHDEHVQHTDERRPWIRRLLGR